MGSPGRTSPPVTTMAMTPDLRTDSLDEAGLLGITGLHVHLPNLPRGSGGVITPHGEGCGGLSSTVVAAASLSRDREPTSTRALRGLRGTPPCRSCRRAGPRDGARPPAA